MTKPEQTSRRLYCMCPLADIKERLLTATYTLHRTPHMSNQRKTVRHKPAAERRDVKTKPVPDSSRAQLPLFLTE